MSRYAFKQRLMRLHWLNDTLHSAWVHAANRGDIARCEALDARIIVTEDAITETRRAMYTAQS